MAPLSKTDSPTETTAEEPSPQQEDDELLRRRRQQQQQQQQGEVAVCCGCRPPRQRKYQKVHRRASDWTWMNTRWNRSARYFDARQGISEMEDLSNDENNNDKEENNDNEDWDKESLFFFDAEQDMLEDDEYPIIFTNTLQHPKPRVTLEEPETLLLRGDGGSVFRQGSDPTITMEHRSDAKSRNEAGAAASFVKRHESEPIVVDSTSSSSEFQEQSLSKSHRFIEITRRSTLEHKHALEKPRVKVPLQGYPGTLTFQELAECQKFLRGLKLLDADVSEQVYSMRDVEEEPYTICRWLRATKFDASKILERLAENQSMFSEARDNDFYPDVSATIGAPFSVFLSQYPFLPIGRGKNGCPVNYFQAGRINPEGILSMTTVDRLKGYFWWSFMYKFKQEIRQSQKDDPDFVRIEGINIIDLQGLSAAALAGETMEVIKLASKISDFFPETLHCMLVLNAPSFFAMSWGIIKKFIDPRTAQRIQVFSNAERGMNALKEMVDDDQIPIDYGGRNKSLKEAFRDEAADPALRRQEVSLVHVRKKQKAECKEVWELAPGEYAEIRVYTRSASAATITVTFKGSVVKSVDAQCEWLNNRNSGDDSSSVTALPKCTLIVEKIVGPGTIKVELQDLDTPLSKRQSHCSRGYFLVVADIKSI